jgi:methylglyoxal synthase
MINLYWPSEKKVCGRKLTFNLIFLHFPSKAQKHTTQIQILSQILRNMNIPKSIKLNVNALV